MEMGAHLSWQGIVVLILVFLPIVLSKLIPLLPRDLLFTLAALFAALTGIVSSSELYQSGVNQAIFTLFGLWLIAKAMQQQGVFHAFIRYLTPVKKSKPLSYLAFFCQILFFGAFFHHRYFAVTTLRPLLRDAEKRRGDLSVFGFPFAYLLLIGGLATAIGTPTNILFLSLYSFSDFFAFLPLALLPIALSLALLFLFKDQFRKPFSQFIDAGACAVVPPDSLLIGKSLPVAIVREGKPIPKTTSLQSGDLLLFTKSFARVPFSQIVLFINSVFSVEHWKKKLVIIIFLAAIVLSLAGISMGTAFLCGGLLVLALRTFPLKKTFLEEFPFPLLLEIFSAYVFFFAMQNSGLSAWIASFISLSSPFLIVTLFFLVAQIAIHGMPRPLAFALLFSIVLKMFTTPIVLLLGTNIAFATAVPLFGKPLLDETAISNAISGKANLPMRALLIFILFLSIVIPTYLIWHTKNL